MPAAKRTKTGRPGHPCIGPDGTVYESTEAAGRAIGIAQRSIWYRAREQRHGWRFAEDAPEPTDASEARP
jgi:hypothetical protein